MMMMMKVKAQQGALLPFDSIMTGKSKSSARHFALLLKLQKKILILQGSWHLYKIKENLSQSLLTSCGDDIRMKKRRIESTSTLWHHGIDSLLSMCL